jgi:small subunit ribosomal protein S9
MAKKSKAEVVATVGRRKTASARVRLYPNKKGGIEVNGVGISNYFPGEANKQRYLKPLKVCDLIGKHKITVKVQGSGKKGQLGAVVHGIARAIDQLDTEKYHDSLKQKGLLTRDPRMKERRKVGTGGKARHKKQSPKR